MNLLIASSGLAKDNRPLSANNIYLTTISMNTSNTFSLDFSQPEEVAQWRATNDNVMGGLSTGQAQFNNNSLLFSGYISTENNGGFSSIYRSVNFLPINADAVEIDVQGDGLRYQLRMAIFINGYRLAYKHDFDTKVDKRQRITLLLRDFKATFRGRLITNAPTLQAQDIRQVGFLVTNKVDGPFSLSVNSLRVLSTTSP